MQRPGVADVLTLGQRLCGAGRRAGRHGLGAAGSPSCGCAVMALPPRRARQPSTWSTAPRPVAGAAPRSGPLDALADAMSFGVAPAVAVARTSWP